MPQGAKSILVRTHFIPLVPSTPDSDTHLLAYEVIIGGARKWVTAFPTREDFVKQQIVSQALAPETSAPFKARFNLHLDVGPDSAQRNLGFFRTR